MCAMPRSSPSVSRPSYAGIASVTARSGKKSGGPGASSVPSASNTRLSHGQRSRSGMPSGRGLTTSRSAIRARPIRPPYGPWPSHGAASSLGAGRSTPPTMKPSLSRRYLTMAHR
jgi:hypothetical protein